MNLNAEIRAEMARQKITVADLARSLGVTRQSASRKLNASHPINNEDLSGVAAALGVPAWELIRRAEEGSSGCVS